MNREDEGMENTQVRFFKALGDETRQAILRILQEEEELCVSDLCQRFRRISQPTISHHLQVLRESDLVGTRRQGKLIFYQLNRTVIYQMGRSFLVQFRSETHIGPMGDAGEGLG